MEVWSKAYYTNSASTYLSYYADEDPLYFNYAIINRQPVPYSGYTWIYVRSTHYRNGPVLPEYTHDGTPIS